MWVWKYGEEQKEEGMIKGRRGREFDNLSYNIYVKKNRRAETTSINEIGF